jgi:hypothetical protein
MRPRMEGNQMFTIFGPKRHKGSPKAERPPAAPGQGGQKRPTPAAPPTQPVTAPTANAPAPATSDPAAPAPAAPTPVAPTPVAPTPVAPAPVAPGPVAPVAPEAAPATPVEPASSGENQPS